MSNMPNSAREPFSEAKESVQEARKTAAAGGADIQESLAGLRDEVTKLTQQLSDIVGSRSNAVWQKAKSNLGGVLSEAESKGMEAVGAVRDVGDNVIEAIDESLKKRPYTTLALAVGIGFLFGATWRR